MKLKLTILALCIFSIANGMANPVKNNEKEPTPIDNFEQTTAVPDINIEDDNSSKIKSAPELKTLNRAPRDEQALENEKTEDEKKEETPKEVETTTASADPTTLKADDAKDDSEKPATSSVKTDVTTKGTKEPTEKQPPPPKKLTTTTTTVKPKKVQDATTTAAPKSSAEQVIFNPFTLIVLIVGKFIADY
jgi:hypothetical protein